MTEQYTPSDYDIHVQNPRIDQLESLISAESQPPAGAQYSFPVVGQGISAQQYQQMSLAQGDGLLITDDSESPYFLAGMPGGDTETNATNQMVLRVAANTGRAESVINGFYHVLYQDMIIDFLPVTTPTTYYLCLTFDPRREKEEHGPIRVELYANDLPRTHGRKHIILWSIHREPNQLLTQAVRTSLRQHVSPTITVRSPEALPETTDVRYGTLAIQRSRAESGEVVPGTGQLHQSYGIHGWHNLLVGPWENIGLTSNWSAGGTGRPPQVRRTLLGYQLRGTAANSTNENSIHIGNLPVGYDVNPLVELGPFILSTTTHLQAITIDGRAINLRLDKRDYPTGRVSFDGIIIPGN